MATRKQQFQLGYNENALFPGNCQREMCSPGGGFSSDQESLDGTEMENDFR